MTIEKDDTYRSKGIYDLLLPQRIIKFISNNSKVVKGGQGNVTVCCKKLWDMSEEEFENTFGIKLVKVEEKKDGMENN